MVFPGNKGNFLGGKGVEVEVWEGLFEGGDQVAIVV
jgi:hypothetical protein